MLYLILAIICGSLFSIVFKLGQRHGVDGRQVIVFNYTVAFLFTLLPIVGRVVFDQGVSAGDFIPEASSWLLALVQGLFFTLGFNIMDRSTRRSGVALTTVCARSSLVLPVLLSWMLLGQSAPSWLPVVLTVAAMVLIIGPGGKEPARQRIAGRAESRYAVALSLLGVFLVFGLSDFFLKVVQHSAGNGRAGDPAGMENLLSALTCIIFLMASLGSLAVCLVSGSFRRNKVTWQCVGWGALLGFANIGCTSCMLRALVVMPTGLFYPLYNIGIVLVAALAGVLFFGERLEWKQVAGLVLAVAAIAVSF